MLESKYSMKFKYRLTRNRITIWFCPWHDGCCRVQTAEYSVARVLCLLQSVLLADRTSGRACAVASVVVFNACIAGNGAS